MKDHAASAPIGINAITGGRANWRATSPRRHVAAVVEQMDAGPFEEFGQNHVCGGRHQAAAHQHPRERHSRRGLPFTPPEPPSTQHVRDVIVGARQSRDRRGSPTLPPPAAAQALRSEGRRHSVGANQDGVHIVTVYDELAYLSETAQPSKNTPLSPHFRWCLTRIDRTGPSQLRSRQACRGADVGQFQQRWVALCRGRLVSGTQSMNCTPCQLHRPTGVLPLGFSATRSDVRSGQPGMTGREASSLCWQSATMRCRSDESNGGHGGV